MNMTKDSALRGACDYYARCSADLISAKERVKDTGNDLYRMRSTLEQTEKRLKTVTTWRETAQEALDRARAALLKAAS